MDTEKLKNYFNKNRKEIFKDFFTFLKFASISTDSEYSSSINECASWLNQELNSIGLETTLWEVPNHPPVVFAKDLSAGPNQPTLLIYNHYDVQPVDPLELWESPPFEPTIRSGEIYARGAVDNKGQCFYVLQALKALKEQLGNFPINIKFIIEGEEECGSEALSELLTIKKEDLKADYALIVDTGIHDKNEPAITLGVRGIVTLTLSLTGSNHDLHSGEHGGLAYNPNRALCEMISKLFDSNGKITIPGFYDSVAEVSPKDLNSIDFDFDLQKYEDFFDIKAIGGEKKYSPLERNWLRPTLEINGISGGYAGTGFKTVIPAKAFAKISCRLVPDQQPEKIISLLEEYFFSQAPIGMRMEIVVHPGGGKALRTNPTSRIATITASVFSEVFEKKCKHILNGASIPIASDLAVATQAEVLLIGLGLPGDQLHAPNEHFGEDRIEKGFLIIAKLIQALKF